MNLLWNSSLRPLLRGQVISYLFSLSCTVESKKNTRASGYANARQLLQLQCTQPFSVTHCSLAVAVLSVSKP